MVECSPGTCETLCLIPRTTKIKQQQQQHLACIPCSNKFRLFKKNLIINYFYLPLNFCLSVWVWSFIGSEKNTNVLWLFLFAFVFWLTFLFWSSRLPEAGVSRILKLPLQASVEEICISVTCYAYHLLILTSLSLSLNKKSSNRLLLAIFATPVFILQLVFYHIWPSCYSW